MGKLLTFERRQQITNLLLNQGNVSARDLAKRFNVTTETIRKDLWYLQQIGIAYKEHGGARLTQLDVEQQLSIRLRNMDKKQMIASKGLSLLDECQSIMIDSGSCCLALAHLLKQKSGLDIITPSLLVAQALSTSYHQVWVTGGRIRMKNQALTGAWAIEAIASVQADICFLGTSGFLDRKGPTTHSYQEIEVKKTMIAHSKKVYILAENNKFQHSGFHAICDWNEIDGIITDSTLTTKQYEKMSELVPVLISEEEKNEKEDCENRTIF